MENLEPLLSIVVVSRNDDHGGNLLQRMQYFVSGWLEQAKKHNVSSELIIVEWNPLPDRAGLSRALKWPENTGPCTVRIIQVPPEIHRRFKYADKLPVFQMIGKNVGIRRARGRFVLATNIDILFNNELMEFFASGKLERSSMYRIDRYDAPADIPDKPIDEQLEYCRQNFLRVNTGQGIQVSRQDFLSKNPLNGFGSTFSRIKTTIQTLPKGENTAVKIWDYLIGLAGYIIVTKIGDFIIFKGSPPKQLHTNACGDFTLLSREFWAKIHGYPEFEMYSMNLDGMGCMAAYYSGASEVILREPRRIYHIEHAPGSGWSPGIGGQLLNERLKASGIPQLTYEQYWEYVKKMHKTRKAILFSDDNWGLAPENLPEIEI
jgi:hypothetical protein